MSFANGVSELIAQEGDVGAQSPLILLSMMIDDSMSMLWAQNFMTVMDGHNSVLDVLSASPSAAPFLARTQYMHGKTLAKGYRPLAQAPRITLKNYHLTSGTPLFTASRRILWYMKRRAQEYIDEGNDVRTLTLLLTDGWNNELRKHQPTAQDVCKVVRPLINSGRHIVAGVGVTTPQMNFRQVFLDMGIPKQWILTLQSPEEIRAAFNKFSQSAQEGSVNPRNFAETLARGFGNTPTQQGGFRDQNLP